MPNTLYTIISPINDPRYFVRILPAVSGYEELGYFPTHAQAQREMTRLHPGAVEVTEGEFLREAWKAGAFA